MLHEGGIEARGERQTSATGTQGPGETTVLSTRPPWRPMPRRSPSSTAPCSTASAGTPATRWSCRPRRTSRARAARQTPRRPQPAERPRGRRKATEAA
jgi:hypothetical protein